MQNSSDDVIHLYHNYHWRYSDWYHYMKVKMKTSLMCNEADNFSTDRYIHITTHRLLLILYSITIIRSSEICGKINYLQSVTSAHIQISYIAFISLIVQTKTTLHCDIDNVCLWDENVLPYSTKHLWVGC